jgi:hypothetical protein
MLPSIGFRARPRVGTCIGRAPTSGWILAQVLTGAGTPDRETILNTYGRNQVAKVAYRYLGASQLVLNENRNDGQQVTTYRYGLTGQRLSQTTGATGTSGAS